MNCDSSAVDVRELIETPIVTLHEVPLLVLERALTEIDETGLFADGFRRAIRF